LGGLIGSVVALAMNPALPEAVMILNNMSVVLDALALVVAVLALWRD